MKVFLSVIAFISFLYLAFIHIAIKHSTMRSAIVVLTLLASAFAAPTGDSTHSSDKLVSAPLEARAYSCNPLRSDPCPGLCAAGSIFINCGASYVCFNYVLPGQFEKKFADTFFSVRRSAPRTGEDVFAAVTTSVNRLSHIHDRQYYAYLPTYMYLGSSLTRNVDEIQESSRSLTCA